MSSARQSLAPKSLVELMGANTISKAVEITLMHEPCQARVGSLIFLIFIIEISRHNTWISPKGFLGIIFGVLNTKINKAIIFFGRS